MITRDDLKPGNRVLIEAEIVSVGPSPTDHYAVSVRFRRSSGLSIVHIGEIRSVEGQDFTADTWAVTKCSSDECGRDALHRGMCQKHYDQHRRLLTKSNKINSLRRDQDQIRADEQHASKPTRE